MAKSRPKVYDDDREVGGNGVKGQIQVPELKMTGAPEIDNKTRGVFQGTLSNTPTTQTGAEASGKSINRAAIPQLQKPATGGGGTVAPAAAATPQMQDVAANNLLSMQSVNGELPNYQFRQGQGAQWNYNGTNPEFSYNGQTPEYSYNGGNNPQFNYNGQGAQFNYAADPQLQAQYQNAMAALEQMKGKAPTYGSQYDQQIQDLYSQIIGRDKFKYDSKTDPLYQQYVQDYTMQGKMAAKDTMGQAAGLTGGYGSSYSQAVGQQMYDQYLQKMADILPETYGMALDAYNAEGNRLAHNLALTQDLEQSDYNRYLDKLNQHNIDIDRARTDADTAYDRMIRADETAYGRAVDQYNRDLTADQQAYNRALDDYQRQLAADETAYNRNMDAYKLAAAREESDYNRALDAYQRQLNADNTAYNRAVDAYNRQTAEDERSYGRQVDEYNRQLNENKLAYDRAMDAIDMQADIDKYNRNTQDAYYDRLVSLIGIGYEPTAQDYANAGLTVKQGQAIRQQYLDSQKPASVVYVNNNKDNTDGGKTEQAGQQTQREIGDYITMYKSLSGSEKNEFNAAVVADIKAGNLPFDLDTWRYAKGK